MGPLGSFVYFLFGPLFIDSMGNVDCSSHDYRLQDQGQLLEGSSQQGSLQKPILGDFPKIRGTFLRVPIIRIIVFWGLYWGPTILGNYHIYPS